MEMYFQLLPEIGLSKAVLIINFHRVIWAPEILQEIGENSKLIYNAWTLSSLLLASAELGYKKTTVICTIKMVTN